MGYGELYYDSSMPYDEWIKKRNEMMTTDNDISKGMNSYMNNATGLDSAGGMSAETNKAQETGVSMLEGMLGTIPVLGQIVGGILGAVNEGIKPQPAGQAANLEKGMEEGVKNSITGLVTSWLPTPEGVDPKAADAAKETANAAPTMGGTYASVSLPKPSEAAVQPTTWDKAKNFTMDKLRAASKGIIGGDYSPVKSSAELYPKTGSFMNDVVTGLSKGGGIDKGIGNLRGGNYGGALGQAARYTVDNYQRPHYDEEDFRKKFDMKYRGGY